jgi:TRAP-type C4-dicarboxylate transport system substrate-binding protein
MRTLSRRQILAAGVAATAGGFFVRGAHAAEFNYKLGLELRDDEPLPKRMLEACKAIGAETNGRLQIQGFPNGQLGNPTETLNQVRSGSLEFLTSSYGMLSGVVPARTSASDTSRRTAGSCRSPRTSRVSRYAHLRLRS